MDQPSTMDTTYSALDALYHNNDSSIKKSASEWLTNMQRSVHAWTISNSLLHDKRNMECWLFGAQTLRNKIQTSFRELPADSHQSLRDSMLILLKQINEATPSLITTQLALSLVYMLLQMTSWREPIKELITQLAIPNGKSLTLLPTVLTLLIEELESPTLNLEANRRKEVFRLLGKSTDDVLRLLDASIQHATIDESVKILNCVASWTGLPEITDLQLTNCATLTWILEALASNQCNGLLHKTASEIVCSVIEAVSRRDEKLHSFENALFKQIQSFEAAYHQSVAEKDVEKALNYCRIFTEIAEAQLPRILKLNQNLTDCNRSELETLMGLMLKCVGHEDYRLAEATFGFWTELADHLSNDQGNVGGKFRIYIDKFIADLHRHCQINPSGNHDDFYEFRSEANYLIQEVVSIINSVPIFKYYNFKVNMNSNESWPATEASLFIMRAVAKNLMRDEPEQDVVDFTLPVIETLLILLETSNTEVAKTSLNLLAELNESIHYSLKMNYSNSRGLVERVLQSVTQAIGKPPLSEAAVRSFEAICIYCADQLTDYYPIFVNLVKAMVPEINIPGRLYLKVIETVVRISYHLPTDGNTEPVYQLCQIPLDQLTRICKDLSTVQHNSSQDPIYWLDVLTTIFRTFCLKKCNENTPAGCNSILAYVEPVLSMTFSVFQNDKRVMGRCCRCLRYLLRLCKKYDALSPLSVPLTNQLVELYSVHRYNCLLRLASVIINEYGNQKHIIPRLSCFLDVMVLRAFQLFDSEQNFRDHSDTIEYLLALIQGFLCHNPTKLMENNILSFAVDIAIVAYSMDDSTAWDSAQDFLINIVDTVKSNSLTNSQEFAEVYDMIFNTILLPKGPLLINSLVTASIFTLPSESMPCIAQLILRLMTAFGKCNVVAWFEHMMEKLPRKSKAGCGEVGLDQIQNFKVQFTTSEKSTRLSKVLKDFAALYR